MIASFCREYQKKSIIGKPSASPRSLTKIEDSTKEEEARKENVYSVQENFEIKEDMWGNLK